MNKGSPTEVVVVLLQLYLSATQVRELMCSGLCLG